MLRPLLRSIILTGCLSSSVISHASAGGKELVDFQLLDLSGQKHALSDYRDRWVIINFWATWCGPCIKEIPELVELQSKYRTTVQVLGINFEPSSFRRQERSSIAIWVPCPTNNLSSGSIQRHRNEYRMIFSDA